ncbi:hypothetical protein LINGRAHAP2_LOCUS32077 [Linum grandiflorum]
MKDKERIFQNQPWAYKSAVINLSEWEAPSQMVFDKLQHMPFVIQLKDIPYPYNTTKFCSKLVEPLGHKIKAPNFSEAATSKQKRKSQKPVPYVFHTYVKASMGESSNAMALENSPSPEPVSVPQAEAGTHLRWYCFSTGFLCLPFPLLRYFQFI